MTSSILSHLEEQINQLSIDEQLWLVGRIAQRIREYILQQNVFDKQLVAMAADPEIQRELQKINDEFTETEADGLETL